MDREVKSRDNYHESTIKMIMDKNAILGKWIGIVDELNPGYSKV